MSVRTTPIVHETDEATLLVQKISSKLAKLSSIDQKARLLQPRDLIADTFGSDTSVNHNLEFYLRAGEAVLRLRSESDVSSPPTRSDVTTPHQGGASRRLGQTLSRDLAFRDRRHELADGGRVWLLYQYTGREYDEIAALLGTDLDDVIDAAEKATEILV